MRFLIFGGPGIGDTILELSMAKTLKNYYRDAQVDLIISSKLGSYAAVQGILSHQDYITTCYCYSKKQPWKTLKTIVKLRAQKYDYSLACATAFKANDVPSKISRIIRCKSIIKEVEGKTGKVDIPVKIDENLHFVEQEQELCRQLIPDSKLDGLVLDSGKIKDYLILPDKEKLITICLGTNITIYWKDGKRIDKNIKAWDTNRWIQVANYLDERGNRVVLIGGRKEHEELSAANESLRESVLNYTGKTTIHESLGIIKQSSVVIGADTGMMHCAAALDIPTITLFGGTDSNVWRPYSEKGAIIVGHSECAPCYGNTTAIECIKRKCMDSITVTQVLTQAIKIMEQ